MSSTDPPPGDEETVYLGVPAQHMMWTQTARAIMTMDFPGCISVDFEEGTTLPAKSRNFIIERFLDSDHDHLFLMDSDMRPPRETYRRLASWGQPAVWALAYSRCPPYRPIPERAGKPFMDPILEGHDGLVEVDTGGAGCILLTREVLEAVGNPWFQGNPEGAREDTYFCHRIREEGYPVLVDYGLCVKHVGATAVDTDFAIAYWQRQANRRREAGGP